MGAVSGQVRRVVIFEALGLPGGSWCFEGVDRGLNREGWIWGWSSYEAMVWRPVAVGGSSFLCLGHLA